GACAERIGPAGKHGEIGIQRGALRLPAGVQAMQNAHSQMILYEAGGADDLARPFPAQFVYDGDKLRPDKLPETRCTLLRRYGLPPPFRLYGSARGEGYGFGQRAQRRREFQYRQWQIDDSNCVELPDALLDTRLRLAREIGDVL